MAERTRRELRAEEIQGVKYLRRLGPLLSRLRAVGTERDRAGNRRLFMDQYCALILLSLFSPAIKIPRTKARRFEAVGQKITAVDGTVIETVKRVAELAWTPMPNGKHYSAYRLHTHFEVLSSKPVRIDATSANPAGEADERAVLRRTVEADRCYILDRGYISYGLWNEINAAGSSYYPEHDVVDCGFRLTERTTVPRKPEARVALQAIAGNSRKPEARAERGVRGA